MDTGESKETNKLLLANLGISKSGGKKVGGSLGQGGGQEVGVGGSEGGGKGVLPRLGERDPQEISAHPAGQGGAKEVGLSLGQGHLGVEVTIDGYQARSKGKLKFHLKQLGVGIGQGNSKEVGVGL